MCITHPDTHTVPLPSICIVSVCMIKAYLMIFICDEGFYFKLNVKSSLTMSIKIFNQTEMPSMIGSTGIKHTDLDISFGLGRNFF